MQRMAELENEVLDPLTYIKLRNLIVCRLVLFNARRGGEPTRLFIKDWEDADSNACFLSKDAESGVSIRKGETSGSNSIPKRPHNVIRMLTDKDVRQACGIATQNSYLIPMWK